MLCHGPLKLKVHCKYIQLEFGTQGKTVHWTSIWCMQCNGKAAGDGDCYTMMTGALVSDSRVRKIEKVLYAMMACSSPVESMLLGKL